MIENFNFYLRENSVKKESPDPIEAGSLIEKAMQRLEYVKKNKIDESNASFIFEDIYDCLREASQSLMSKMGYKSYSHEAIIAFMKEFFAFSDYDISVLDRYRILRNNSVYRAEKVSKQTCIEALDFAKKFLPKIRKEFESRK